MFFGKKKILFLFFCTSVRSIYFESPDWAEDALDPSSESTIDVSGDISGEDIAGELDVNNTTSSIDQNVPLDVQSEEMNSSYDEFAQNSNALNLGENNSVEHDIGQAASSFQNGMQDANTGQQMIGAVGGGVGGIASLALGAAMIKQAFGGSSSKATESQGASSDDTEKSINSLTKRSNKRRK